MNNVIITEADRLIAMGLKLTITNRYKKPIHQNWPKIATSDPNLFRLWIEDHQKANIAIATGSASNVFVVDIDVKNGVSGYESLAAKFGELEYDDDGLLASTPSGGMHFYFQCDPTLSVRSTVGVLPGVDIRGDGGYIIAPPSWGVHNGAWQQYQWSKPNGVLTPAPDWARELITLSHLPQCANTPSTRSAFDPALAMKGIAQGQRNYELNRFFCHLSGLRLSESIALPCMFAAASLCNPPLSTSELTRLVSKKTVLPNKQADELKLDMYRYLSLLRNRYSVSQDVVMAFMIEASRHHLPIT